MGLDITAYRGLVEAKGKEAIDESGEFLYDEGWTRFYPSDDFPGRADDIKDGQAYKAAEEFGFRAGSYSSYSRWREQLAELAGYPAAVAAGAVTAEERSYRESFPHAAAAWEGGAEQLPFYELVNFTDCDGVLGTAVSAKLAKDFAAFQHKADAHPDPWFAGLYTHWRKAFEMASDKGCVVFNSTMRSTIDPSVHGAVWRIVARIKGYRSLYSREKLHS
jgi:hypothetical protein